MKVRVLTDFPERFAQLKAAIVQTKEGYLQHLHIARFRLRPPFVHITFVDHESREAAQHLQGGLIQVEVKDRMPLPKGSFFQSEFIGVDVFLENGCLLGRISDIIETGSNDVFVVRDAQRESLIPALQKIVLELDLDKKKMVIDSSKGLVSSC